MSIFLLVLRPCVPSINPRTGLGVTSSVKLLYDFRRCECTPHKSSSSGRKEKGSSGVSWVRTYMSVSRPLLSLSASFPTSPRHPSTPTAGCRRVKGSGGGDGKGVQLTVRGRSDRQDPSQIGPRTETRHLSSTSPGVNVDGKGTRGKQTTSPDTNGRGLGRMFTVF